MENESGFIAVIPDIKSVSPKEGDLFKGRDPADTAKQLVSIGAPVLSVVTQRLNFGGSPGLLSAVIAKAGVPVLRKDFITSEDMLKETAELGADAVLIICSVIDEKRLNALYQKSLALGLEPLVEVASKREIEWAKKLGAKLIGINNRDIVSLEKDGGGPSKTAELALSLKPGTVFISESGIQTPEDAKTAANAGASAILVGTALWLSENMGETYRKLRVPYGVK
jgi:indole-3-glycerol phosphate synthase